MNFEDDLGPIPAFHHGRQQEVAAGKLFRLDLPRRKAGFLAQLRREECRADRAKAPLSLALVRFDNRMRGDPGNVKGDLELFQHGIRETDIVGYLDEDVIGIILPDTDEEGAQAFKRRVFNGCNHLPSSMITRTYPNQLFYDLLTESQNPYITYSSQGNPAGIRQRDREKPLYRTTSLPLDLLPKSAFLKQLRHEERRADRAKASLSLALIRFGDRNPGEPGNIKGVLELLQNHIRETDTPGYLDENVIGIILPDMDEKGTQAFKARVVNGYDHFPFSMITQTYPNQLYDYLLTNNQNRSDCYPFFLADSKKSNRLTYSLKRGLDIVGALAGLLLLSPLMLITALAIKLTSPGPVIFKQIRLGASGVPFVFYKFRSMFWNTDDQIHRDYITHLIQGNLEEINQGDKEKPLYKIKSDPRITRLGRIIRKTSIDELPQLVNVLKGEMSLVGPRPPLPYEVEKYQSWHLRRILEMKPGITGLWQVDGRSVTSFDDMVRFDLRYIRHWSLMLDLKILIKTVKAVFRSAGAV